MCRRDLYLRTLPVQTETVQPGAGATGEVREVTAGVGGDEGRAPATSHRSVHLPVISHELQLVQPPATPALDDEDLGPGVELEGVETAASSTVSLPPHLAVLGSDGVHLRPSPHLYLGYHPIEVNFASVSPQAAPVT